MEKTVKVIVMDNKIAKTFEAFNSLSSELKEIIVGKDEQIDKTLACLLAKGHILLEDMPGVGKTTLASALASAIRGSFSRIQFTSDLLPFDIIGSKIYRRQTEIFEFKKGPIFSNVVLADELNRTSPKTQSALLQAMNEASVSVDKITYDMPKPFIVIATQNPCGSSGTYPLPESQMDRFMMRELKGQKDSFGLRVLVNPPSLGQIEIALTTNKKNLFVYFGVDEELKEVFRKSFGCIRDSILALGNFQSVQFTVGTAKLHKNFFSAENKEAFNANMVSKIDFKA